MNHRVSITQPRGVPPQVPIIWGKILCAVQPAREKVCSSEHPRRSTSASVRCSCVRKSRSGRRRGVTVRFTVAGVISFRRVFVIYFTNPERGLFVQDTFFEQSRPYLASAGTGGVYCDRRGAGKTVTPDDRRARGGFSGRYFGA